MNILEHNINALEHLKREYEQCCDPELRACLMCDIKDIENIIRQINKK